MASAPLTYMAAQVRRGEARGATLRVVLHEAVVCAEFRLVAHNFELAVTETSGNSELATQRYLGSFGGTGQARIPSTNAAPLQLWLFVQPGTQQLCGRGIFACLLA